MIFLSTRVDESVKSIPSKKSTIATFPKQEVDTLIHMYQTLYPEKCIETTVPTQTFRKMKNITINNQSYQAGQVVLAKSVFALPSSSPEAHQPRSITSDPTLRAAVIRYFALYALPCDDEELLTHMFAVVDWLMTHPLKDRIGKPYIGYCNSLFESSPENFVVPVEYISTILLSSSMKIEEETILLTVPLIN